ncbi:MjaI family restriction endonuclease [Brevibacillus sp. NPDC058079]|uniref:MjaI family restriction endonuclease n=1 Tax=Brevibacillus sp. NPDC058079 TaxID=3346330 RepID=UPI0036E0A374
MDLFHNQIDAKKFRSTNAMWNAMKMNSPMSVGYVTNLIESRSFSAKEEWRDYYYESGRERLILIEKNGSTKDLHLNYGRTEEELKKLGEKMYAELEKRGNLLGITLAECVYMVKYRVMGETWNGVVMREKNTIQKLENFFPTFSFCKVDGAIDYKYAIDYEVFHGSILVCALQIKPLSYEKGSSPEILKAKFGNKAKNELYEKEKGVPVFYVYSKIDGAVLNQEVIEKLMTFVNTQQAA